MVKPDNPPGQQKNTNSEQCTTCTHARSFHQQKLYYCKADIMTDDPNKPGKAKIKAPCPCTKFTSDPILTVDNPNHGFSDQDSPNKGNYNREGVDITATVQTPSSESEPSKGQVMRSDDPPHVDA